jgi:CubicO group peptidase (beta-lactamase class C family)
MVYWRAFHSNIGWNIAGLIAARVAGEPLASLYQQRIFSPLGLKQTSYQPQGPIAGPHAEGYSISANGALTDATAWTYGKGADGAIVTDAADEATFLRALVDDRLHVRQQFLDFYSEPGTDSPGCPGNAFVGQGAGAASRSYVYYDQTGRHIAVLLLNGFRQATAATGDPKAEAAALELYCDG